MIDELRLSHKLNKILKVVGLSKSTYEYYHSKKHLNSVYNKALKEDKILSIVAPIFTHHKKRYGSKRVILAAKDKLKGINHKTIERVMAQNGLKLLKRGRPSMAKQNKEVAKKDPKDMTREELLEALEMATIENEYLKKLSALVQKRKAQEQKKK